MSEYFRDLVDRAAREAWPLWRLIDAIDDLPPEQRWLARMATLHGIASELDRRHPTWREKAPKAPRND